MEKKIEITMIPNKRIFYNPQSYLRFLKANKKKIRSVSIQPPRLGSSGFGRIEVETNVNVSYGKQSVVF